MSDPECLESFEFVNKDSADGRTNKSKDKDQHCNYSNFFVNVVSTWKIRSNERSLFGSDYNPLFLCVTMWSLGFWLYSLCTRKCFLEVTIKKPCVVTINYVVKYVIKIEIEFKRNHVQVL